MPRRLPPGFLRLHPVRLRRRHDVCARELLSECVPDEYLPFYERTYCPFAECMSKTTASYESCECDYYKDYCELYYQFEESIGKCEVSTCCEGEGSDTKWKCLEAFSPTYNPTDAPTDSTNPASHLIAVKSFGQIVMADLICKVLIF